MNNFIHLHVHTEYSLLDGAARIKDVVKAAREMGMNSLAITDHGVMYGVVDFYKCCKKEGIKPILGCEVYVAPRTMKDRTPKIDDDMYHLVLLAENQTGYQNLLRLVSMSFTEGFYYKPRVDLDALADNSEGLIALSGCLAGHVPGLIIQGKTEDAARAAGRYREIFGPDNFFLEIQDHGMPEQRMINPELVKLGRRLNIPLVATNDVHYVKSEHAGIQDVLLCIQTGKNIDDEDRMRFSTKELYLKSQQEMTALFKDIPDALATTVEIAERCAVELEFGKMHLPYYRVPEGFTVESYLRDLCYRGMKKRYRDINEKLEKRLEYELDIIEQMGYSAYFLIVWDFINYARVHNIPVGPGRGSAAGSIVAYCLGITNIDPMRYDLLFERFLNPERVSMPDIDVDFCFERRGEVIDYVVEKYGKDRVAQIITFGTMAARAAIRDVGRVLNMPYGEVDKVAKMVPAELGMTIEKALELSPDLKELVQSDEQVRHLIELASGLEGMPRHASTHAAGVVIARNPLTDYVPLYKTSDGAITTQFAKEQVEELGLLKMDLLGLRTLTVIGDAVKQINHTYGINLIIDEISLEDPKTYELLAKGEGIGVFQLESSGMRSILRELKPERFEDIVALVALYRPGPLGSGMVEDFIKGKHGEKKVNYLHPKLEPILKDTYGVILYQEQVMRIASDLAGFTLGEADLLRRAMGKKKPEIIAGLREQFISGAGKNKVDPKVAGEIFDLMEYFAGYGFNKSHSAAYAMVSYQTAYLKANYPLEYMAALLTSVQDNTDKLVVYINECKRLGMNVLPPDVNESRHNFTVVDDTLRFGLAAIKNVGSNAVEAIIKNREREGPFKSYEDFCRRLDTKVVNRRVLESMIKGGAFDSLGYRRAQLMSVLEAGLELSHKSQKERESGQLSLMEMWSEKPGESLYIEIPDVPEYAREELLAMEKETLGLYITGHPLDNYKDILESIECNQAMDIAEFREQQQVSLCGLISAKKQINTRKGDLMAFLTLEDLTGSVEIIVFPELYRKYYALLEPDFGVLIQGNVTNNGEDAKVVAREIFSLKSMACELYLRINKVTPEFLTQLQQVLRRHSGVSPVYLYFPQKNKMARAGNEYWVDLNTPVLTELEDLLGSDNIKVINRNESCC